jgi:SpoVK/Ycf46/Vps4 family AAA+-type ATPase
LAAEVIAGSLGLDLYRVDLSQIVNKYIGETEKQLARVFAAAEMSPVVLFFDEADALLGRRSAVSDSHDRYANIEVAYLLQRIERYNGVVVLASNLAKNIDEAFIRRIHISVDFPMPGARERRRMWGRAFPASAPVSELDLDQIADKFAVSGASIRNAAITAAFLAAEAGTPISMEAVVEGIRREMHKSGHYVRDDLM